MKPSSSVTENACIFCVYVLEQDVAYMISEKKHTLSAIYRYSFMLK